MRLPVNMIASVLGARQQQLNCVLTTVRYANTVSLVKSNWKKDVVYLYQFPRSPVIPNLSPFCLKVETFLRANNIKYEITASNFQRSSRGFLPFIELNGKQVADSQVILWTLQKHYNIEDGCSKDDLGSMRAIERMVDCSTVYGIMQDRIVLNGKSFLNRNISGLPLPSFVTDILAKRFAAAVKPRIGKALGKLTRDELKEMMRRDIAAIDTILGDKKFLFGDRMTTADCSVFGQLAVAYFLPFRQHLTDLLDDDYPRVKHYLERIRTHYYPEWKDN